MRTRTIDSSHHVINVKSAFFSGTVFINQTQPGSELTLLSSSSPQGYGGLSLSIEGPSKADIECHDNEDGSCRVTYKPTEPGMYNINVKFADKHVPGSPFTVNIGGAGRLTERIVRERHTADTTCVGSACELSLKVYYEIRLVLLCSQTL